MPSRVGGKAGLVVMSDRERLEKVRKKGRMERSKDCVV